MMRPRGMLLADRVWSLAPHLPTVALVTELESLAQDIGKEAERAADRIDALEAAIREITHETDGKVFNAFEDYVDLGEKALILRDVHRIRATLEDKP